MKNVALACGLAFVTVVVACTSDGNNNNTNTHVGSDAGPSTTGDGGTSPTETPDGGGDAGKQTLPERCIEQGCPFEREVNVDVTCKQEGATWNPKWTAPKETLFYPDDAESTCKLYSSAATDPNVERVGGPYLQVDLTARSKNERVILELPSFTGPGTYELDNVVKNPPTPDADAYRGEHAIHLRPGCANDCPPEATTQIGPTASCGSKCTAVVTAWAEVPYALPANFSAFRIEVTCTGELTNKTDTLTSCQVPHLGCTIGKYDVKIGTVCKMSE